VAQRSCLHPAVEKAVLLHEEVSAVLLRAEIANLLSMDAMTLASLRAAGQEITSMVKT
jgi:hypothetical protein